MRNLKGGSGGWGFRVVWIRDSYQRREFIEEKVRVCNMRYCFGSEIAFVLTRNLRSIEVFYNFEGAFSTTTPNSILKHKPNLFLHFPIPLFQSLKSQPHIPHFFIQRQRTQRISKESP